MRAILFDLDNTLIDRNQSLRTYAARFRTHFSGTLSNIETERLCNAMIEVDDCGHISRDQFFEKLAYVLPWADEPDVEAIQWHWFATFPGCSEPMEGMHETLASLREKGIALGLVTNGKTTVQKEKIDVVGLRSYMQSIIISDSVQLKKPDARIFQLALRELNVEAHEAWFVGDHPAKDIAGAATVGLTTVWIRHGQRWSREDCLPHFQIDCLNELLHLIDSV